MLLKCRASSKKNSTKPKSANKVAEKEGCSDMTVRRVILTIPDTEN